MYNGNKANEVTLRLLGILLLAGGSLEAQYDKVAALGSDSTLTPMGGPASSPAISSGLYDLADLRPTGKLNDRLPLWLQFGLDERLRVESGNDGWYALNRFRFGMLMRPARWFKVVAQVQDARSFLQATPLGLGPPNNVRWDLKLAYLQLGDPEKQAVTVTAGRQLLDYNSTIIGNSEWRNQARSYDGVVTNVRLNGFRAAVFVASVVNPQLNGVSHHQAGNNIYGVYGWMTRVIPKSSVEPFVLWRVAPVIAVEQSSAKSGRLDERAYGMRVRGTGIARFDYRGEVIVERGRAASNEIRAWGVTAGVGYTIASLAWKPRLFGGSDFASGDRNPADGRRGTFDAMYPTAHDRVGITDQIGWQNILAWRSGATVTPRGRWSLTGQYVDLRLASARDAVYSSSGGIVARDASGRSGLRLGREADFYTWYEINRQVHVGAGVGRLFAGEFLARAGKGAGYTYPYLVIEMFDGKRVR